MIPIRTDYRMTSTPWINYALVASNVLLFVIGFNGMTQKGILRINNWMLHPDSPELYQFFSSVFLHGGWAHLLGNMLFLWVFGNALNDRLGHFGYLAFYLAGGVIACVGYLLLSGNAPVLGASGAISAVAGAYLVLFPRVRVTVLFFFFYLIHYAEISSLVFLLIQFVWNMYLTLQVTTSTGYGGGVAYAAHSAGYVFGIAAAAAMLAMRLLPRDAFDLLNLIRTYRRRSKYRRMVSQGYDPFNPLGPARKPSKPGRRWVQTQAVESEVPATAATRELELRREISDACNKNDLAGAAAKYLQLVQIADQAILPRQQQLDVANQFMASNQHPAAADAYERFLKHYGSYEHIADIYLMLGLLYCRYLHRHDRAEQMLSQAVDLLDDPSKIELAKNDLQKLRGHGPA